MQVKSAPLKMDTRENVKVTMIYEQFPRHSQAIDFIMQNAVRWIRRGAEAEKRKKCIHELQTQAKKRASWLKLSTRPIYLNFKY